MEGGRGGKEGRERREGEGGGEWDWKGGSVLTLNWLYLAKSLDMSPAL